MSVEGFPIARGSLAMALGSFRRVSKLGQQLLSRYPKSSPSVIIGFGSNGTASV